MKPLMAAITAFAAPFCVLNAEDFFYAEHHSVGRGSLHLVVPWIVQVDEGMIVYTGAFGEQGGTYFDQWFTLELELPFPLIAISEYRVADTPEAPEGTVLFVSSWNSTGYLEGELETEVLDSFDTNRNAGWVDSLTLGWLYMPNYPWVFSPQLGWLSVTNGSPAWYAMTFICFSPEQGWLLVPEATPGWYFSYETGEWKSV